MTNPHTIGIIMDGNRRWARERGLSTREGHERGFDKISEVMAWAEAAGVKEVILYAFSTENWNRSPEEVEYLLKLFSHALTEGLTSLIERGVRVRFIGDRTRFSSEFQTKMVEVEERSQAGTGGTLAVALSYGGRAEILHAVQTLIADGVQEVSEEVFASALWSAGLTDPDIIIRTGGESRLSNFLTWQSVYSELFFLPVYWPDFSKEDFDGVLAEYAAREKRHGR